MKDQVDILLATYQGGAYLEDLLESIFTQTHHLFHLYVRDDGSTDQTMSILKKWSETFPHNMTIISTPGNLGVKGNFSELMRYSQAPYIMFADQDDKWLPFKVEESLAEMKAMERQYDAHLPLLVHTDLKVVDQHLKDISPSFWKYAGINPEKDELHYLLAQNIVTGCTLLINRSLAQLASPIPKASLMHDWWIALVAATFGHIRFLNHPTLLYRQHSNNDVGARPYALKSFFTKKRKTPFKNKTIEMLTYDQARYFAEVYAENLHDMPETNQLIRTYSLLDRFSYFNRIFAIISNQFFKQGFLRNVKFLFFP